MKTWLYAADRRLTVAEQNSQPRDKTCLLCGGRLLRLAERETYRPYQWVPTGYVCSACNGVYLEIGA